MKEERFETGKAPHIEIVECQGDCIIRSWLDAAVSVKGDCAVIETEAGLSITAAGRLQLLVPAQSRLAIKAAHGDVVMKNIAGSVQLDESFGDTILSGVGPVEIGTVHQDLSAKNVDGRLGLKAVLGDALLRNVSDVTAATIHGDCSARNVNGHIHVEEIMGDLRLQTINGDVHIERGHRDANLRNLGGKNHLEQISGDIRLLGGLSAKAHHLAAEGDIVIRWPVDAPLNLVATAPKIAYRLPFEQVDESEGALTAKLGDGETDLTLRAGRRIILKEARLVKAEWKEMEADESEFEVDIDFADLGEQISSQVSQQISRLRSEFAGHLEKAMARAEQAAEKAQRRTEKELRVRYRRQPPAQPPTKAPPPKKPPVSAEEQLRILKMVEQGVITAEEARLLLDALEG